MVPGMEHRDVPVVELSASHLSAEPGSYVTVRLGVKGRGVGAFGDDRADLPSAAQGVMRWDGTKARYVGQLPGDFGHAVVVSPPTAGEGHLSFLSIRPGSSGEEIGLFVFEVLDPAYAHTFSFALDHVLTEEVEPLVVLPLSGVREDFSVPRSDEARHLEWSEWADHLPGGAGLNPTGGPARVPGQADVFGDGNQDGVVNVLDVLYTAVLSVVNRSLGECILDSDSPPRDCVAVNVFPTNLPGLGEAADPCPPGTEAACAGDRRLINVLDVLLIANESVGTDQPVVGEAIPKATPVPGVAERSGAIIGTDTLVADSVYRLVGVVTVGTPTSSGEMVIEAGTRILGSTGSALVVSRNGRLIADGTRIRPIVFTCESAASPGCWGGIVVNGNASSHPGSSASPEVLGRSIGGCSEQSGGASGPHGGCAPADSSGVLRFVHVEYAGSDGRALDLRSVGTGTVLEHIHAHRSRFIGLHVEGGEARLRHVRATGNQSIGLSWAGGWTGALQYGVIQAPSTALNAIDGQNSPTSPDAIPRSAPHLRNVTIVGPPMQGVAFSAASVRVRDGSGARLESFLVTGQPTPEAYVFDIDGSASWQEFEAGTLTFEHSVIVGFGRLGDLDVDDPGGTGFYSPDAEGQYLAAAGSGNVVVVDFDEVEGSLFGPWTSVPDLRVEPAGPVGGLTCEGLSGDAFFDDVTYCGAFEVASSTVIPWMEPGPRFDASAISSDPQPGYLEYQVTSVELGILPGVTVNGPTPGVTGLDGWYRSYTPAGPYFITLSGLPDGCVQPPGSTLLTVPAPREMATADTYENLGIVVDCSGAVP